jgi:FkbM family methyltransferase
MVQPMQSPYLVENRHIAVKHCRHGVFMYSRNDAFVGRGLDLYGEWCEFEIRTLRPFIGLGDTVVDVGANIGTHTVAFANMVGQTGTVHSFEPQRRLFSMLAGNVALNALEWVVCHHEAVGDATGYIQLPPLPSSDTFFNYSAVSLVPNNAPRKAKASDEKVPLVTLDSLELGSCAAIKMDVEGMEPSVLLGARQTIKRCQPVLYVEIGGKENTKTIADFLSTQNYTAYWSIHPYFDERNYYSNTVNVWPNVVWSSNIICLPKKSAAEFPEAQRFLGEGDDWRACLNRMHPPK